MEVRHSEIIGLYSFLNDLLFEGTLTRPMITWGECAPEYSHHLGYFQTYEDSDWVSIHLNIRNHQSLDDVVGTLAHEMVHQLQHDLGLPLDHEDFFQGYADACRDLLGIDV